MNGSISSLVFIVFFATDVYLWVVVVAFYRQKPVRRPQEQSV
jgi:hypothetical protein